MMFDACHRYPLNGRVARIGARISPTAVLLYALARTQVSTLARTQVRTRTTSGSIDFSGAV